MEDSSKKKYDYIGIVSGLCILVALGVALGVTTGPWFFIPFTTYVLLVDKAALYAAFLLSIPLVFSYIKRGGKK